MDYLELRDFYSLKVFPALNFFRMPHVIIRASTVGLISHTWCAWKVYLRVLGPLHAIIPLSVESACELCSLVPSNGRRTRKVFSQFCILPVMCFLLFLCCLLVNRKHNVFEFFQTGTSDSSAKCSLRTDIAGAVKKLLGIRKSNSEYELVQNW